MTTEIKQEETPAEQWFHREISSFATNETKWTAALCRIRDTSTDPVARGIAIAALGDTGPTPVPPVIPRRRSELELCYQAYFESTKDDDWTARTAIAFALNWREKQK